MTTAEKATLKQDAIQKLRNDLIGPDEHIFLATKTTKRNGDNSLYKTYAVYRGYSDSHPEMDDITALVCAATGFRPDGGRLGLGYSHEQSPASIVCKRLASVLFGDENALRYRELVNV